MSGELFVVATPIGNLSDLSRRAAEVLAGCDFVAAEDTRVTLRLLNHLGLKKPLVSCYRENERRRMGEIIDRLLGGESCALCSDAGTPGVSDPGEQLVRAAREAGIKVTPVPGCCAAVTALCASGMPSGRFCFEGFLPRQGRELRQRLQQLAGEERTMIFYEAPHRLERTLEALAEAFGPGRRLCLCRELTKLHEQLLDLTLGGALELCRQQPPRGELVLIVEGAARKVEALSPEAALELIGQLRRQGCSLSEACRRAAAESGLPKGELYRMALEAER